MCISILSIYSAWLIGYSFHYYQLHQGDEMQNTCRDSRLWNSQDSGDVYEVMGVMYVSSGKNIFADGKPRQSEYLKLN